MNENTKDTLQFIGAILLVIVVFGGLISMLVWIGKDNAKHRAQKKIIFFECTKDNPLEWCYDYILKGDFSNK